jgi:hypothetical protein
MPLYRDFLSGVFPETIVPPSRFGINVPPRLGNSTGTGAEIAILNQTLCLFPILVPKQITITSIQVRTGGGATYWPNAAAIPYYFRWYEMGIDGLPGTPKTSTATGSFSAGTTANTWVTIGSTNLVFDRGIYWFGLAAGASSFSLAGSSAYNPGIESLIFQKIIGLGSTQTSEARCLVTAINASFDIPDDLTTRLLDLTFATASQTTLRVRVTQPVIWASYT